MNQILETSSDNKKKKRRRKAGMPRATGPSDIIRVVQFFAIGLICFGVFMIGSASYGIYRESNEKSKNVQPVDMSKPKISVEQIDSDSTTILLKVTSNIGIDKLVYRWNDGKTTTLSGNGGKYLEQKVQIPRGSNVLNISVTDIQKQESTYSKKYELNSKIELNATNDGKIQISYQGDKEISYITYRWDDQDEKTIEIHNNVVDEKIDILNGRHTLTVVVVDVDNRTETKFQETNGVAIPDIEISFKDEDRTAYVIKVTDDVELQEVIITLNDDENQRFGQKLTGKEFQFEIPLQEDSDNKMKVQVTNSDDQTVERAVMFRK